MLITPHGDLKRSADPHAHPQRLPLITPHGDLKRMATMHVPVSLQFLITPHGDLKHDVLGIDGHEGQVLITPHGDLKPAPTHRSSRGSPYTHYPSWGFETGDDTRHCCQWR